MEVIARRREIQSLAAQGHSAAAIHRQLGLSCSLRSLQRWVRHMRSGRLPVTPFTAPHRAQQPATPDSDVSVNEPKSSLKQGYQRKTFAPGELF
ncbi:hypothetical protein GCM10027396_08530 [Insolitispirillum peregrinum]